MHVGSVPRVLVTLEQVYNERNGQEIPLSLRYGTGDARVVSPYESEGLPQAAEFTDAGAHLDLFPRQLARIQPGAPDAVELFANDLERNAAIVPMEAAWMWFGNPNIPKSMPQHLMQRAESYRLTYNYERLRVARYWGDYKRPQLALNGKISCTKGANDFDPALIGPPRVPHVRIERVTQSGKTTGEPYRPWDHFRWEEDVQWDHPEAKGAAPIGAQASAFPSYSIEQLEQILAHLKSQEDKGKKGAAAHA